ncbi:MAG: hypothetical protein ABI158_13630 [Edaphobacter sp.]
MEDPRLSRMYATLWGRKLSQVRHNAWRWMMKRSGLLMTIGTTAILLLVALALKERGRGHLTKLRTELNVRSAAPHKTAPLLPGGQDAVVLSRTQVADMGTPEFVSATLLPGRGMNVLQIVAYIPQKGEVNLLASPDLDEAAKLLSGAGEDSNGSASLTMGGAIEAPWAGRIWGAATADGTRIDAMWRGHDLSLPAARSELNEIAISAGGLLLKRRADAVKTHVMPDGGEAQVIYDAGNFDGHWISQTEITTTVQLSGRSLEMSVSARNTGNQAEPIGIGWQPRFAVLNKDRRQILLKLPNALHAEVADERSGKPSGKLKPVEGTQYDFTERNGARLGTIDLNDSFVHLKPGLFDNGPIAELRDPANNYGLRITLMSTSIKAIRVYAPADASFVSIDPQFNYDDPFGRQWAKGEDTGMVVLQPGQTVQWKIRLEIFSLAGDASQHL